MKKKKRKNKITKTDTSDYYTEVFSKGKKLKEPNPQDYKENEVEVYNDNKVPSIAVIPFDNKGADEDIFFV